MSATAANQKKQARPALATTGRGAALYITLGIFSLTLGLAWALSLLIPGSDSYVLSQLSLALRGLCGPLCPGLPALLIWGGAKLLVASRHRVAVKDFVIVCSLYWLVLAGYTLIARVSQGVSYSLPYMDYVGSQNQKTMPYGADSFAAYLNQAFMQRSSGAGGLLGMLLAYPLWKLLSRLGGVLLVLAAMISLTFLLFHINPGDLFRSASEQNEKRRLRQRQKRLEREREAAAQQAAIQPVAAQPAAPQEYAVDPINPGQKVDVQETVYAAPPDSYQPAPVYQVQPGYQPIVSKQQEQNFYPVQPDLYDERFPLHDTPVPETPAAQRPVIQEAPAAASQPEQTDFDAPAPPAETSAAPLHRRSLRRIRLTEEQAATETPAPAAPATQEKPKPPVPAPAPAQMAPQVQHALDEEDDLPWESDPEPARPEPTPPIRKESSVPRPAASQPAEKKPVPSPADSWATQVQQKKNELDMPRHTTQKGEPVPVYTDPVMPIPSERIPIKPREELKPLEKGQRLDGTAPPKARQGSMDLSVPYQAPPMRLLKEARHIPQADAAQEDERRAQIIEETLRSFSVESEVKQIMHGPSITRFAIQIAPGVKVSRVANTSDNLALELKTQHVRVEAPIQGTNYIGIEVPNQLVSTVSLREVLDSPEMNANPSPLLVALGKDIAGAPVLCDLSKMPHLLIAGATGSGKSVCINSIVCSLLYRTSPDQVRLIMVDPKQVELSVYNGIPHLLVPVVSDPRKAAGALSWVVQEMLERYGKFSAQNVRNLAGYNKVNQGTDQVLPNIVVIIDEMADLMEVCRKDVEESIRRLAALARAAGIYMVLATQRPSVDVITGVIKNNIPSRIAFAVSSGTDSRTIIDINGAEKLMGKGDMLYKPTGTSPVRVQGCFVSDDEVNAITEYIGSRYQAEYDPNIVEHLDNAGKEQSADEISGGTDDESGSSSGGEGSFQDLLQQAIEMAVEDGQSSTSMLQRRLRVGYARAGRLIDEMEKRGIISQSEGSKPRKTLITREQYYSMLRDD